MATSNFNDLEKSIDQGRPIEFYEFRLPINDAFWLHAATDEDQVIDGNVWKAAAISRENIQQTGEYVNDALKIECPSWIGPAQLFMTSAPSYPLTVVISTMHAGSTERLVSWQGEIKQVNFPIPGRATMTCESLSSTFRRVLSIPARGSTADAEHASSRSRPVSRAEARSSEGLAGRSPASSSVR